MKKHIFLFFLLLILTISITTANTNYTETGGYDGYYNLGSGLFNTDMTTETAYTRNLDVPKQTPIVVDLDDDGINEIIVLDNVTFRLYNTKELTIVDSYTPNITGTSPFFITYNIDGDNYTEIIVASNNGAINILEYNGTHFYTQNQLALTSIITYYVDGEIMLKCKGVEDCVVISVSHQVNNGVVRLLASFFNSTAIGTELALDGTGSGNDDTFCFPLIKDIMIADYDNDNDMEYIFSYINVNVSNQATDEDYNLYYIYVNATIIPVPEQAIEVYNPGDLSGLVSTGGCSGQNWGKYLTSPLVFDIDASSSNGLETVIGFMKDSNEYRMYSYNSDGTFLDDYPETVDSDGIIISNVFLSNYFEDTGIVDFCVMGYQDTLGTIDLTCASEQTSENPETNEITMSITSLYNVSHNYSLWKPITHSVQHTSILTDGVNLHEVINSYGIIQINRSTCSILGNCDMGLIYQNPYTSSNNGAVVLSVDVENTGYEDLLILTDTNLWYLDDGFINQNAEVTRVTTNPSISSVIAVNQTVHTTIECIDINGDSVQSKQIAYLGDSNRQNTTWTALSGSGSTFPLTFEANKTTSNGLIRFMCRDSKHNSSNNFTVSFTVANNGIVFGDSIYDSGNVTIPIADNFTGEFGTDYTADDNAIRTGIIGLSNDLSMTPTIFMFLFIIIADFLILVMFFLIGNDLNIDGLVKLLIGLIFMFDIFVLIGFAYMRLLSVAFYVTILFLFIVIGIVYVITRLGSTNNNN